MSTAATVMTPEDLLHMPDEGKGYELVNGELKELNVSKVSSYVAGRVFSRLDVFCEAHHPAWVFPEGTSFRCFPDDRTRVRRADTSVILLDRLPATSSDEGHISVVPDLVAEVVSPNDLAGEVEEKLAEWLGAGVKVVWIVNPATRTVRVHLGDGGYQFLRAGDTLAAPGLLPGFAVPVADLFRLPGEPAPAPPAPVS